MRLSTPYGSIENTAITSRSTLPRALRVIASARSFSKFVVRADRCAAYASHGISTGRTWTEDSEGKLTRDPPAQTVTEISQGWFALERKAARRLLGIAFLGRLTAYV